MGLWHLKRGEFSEAERHFRKAIERLTRRNANPYDGEPFYNLGLCLRYLGRDDEAYDRALQGVLESGVDGGGLSRAGGDGLLPEKLGNRAGASAPLAALQHRQSPRAKSESHRAAKIETRPEKQKCWLRETLALDPLDWWARVLADGHRTWPAICKPRLTSPMTLPAPDFSHAAIELLENAKAAAGDLPDQSWGALPLVHYTLGWLHAKIGRRQGGAEKFSDAPPRCRRIIAFRRGWKKLRFSKRRCAANPKDAKAPYYLGNLLYDRRRHAEAIRLWEKSARLDANFSIVWRNLGIGYFNISKKPKLARAAYDQALRVNLGDARLLFERDQLWKRLGESPAKRLRELEKFPQLVSQRDDLTVEFCALLNQTGRPLEAMRLLAKRHFQPWEGGEGAALGQHVRTQLALGRAALARHDFPGAVSHFENALRSPRNLGEAKHLLANQSDIHYWLGCALAVAGAKSRAKQHWRAAANFKGDFQEMSVRAFSEMTYYSALASEKLGQRAKARKLFRDLLAYAQQLQKTKAKIDYFATSLPTMLLFDDDLQYRQETTALFLQAQARLGLGQTALAKEMLQHVLQRDPNHALANDLNHGLS